MNKKIIISTKGSVRLKLAAAAAAAERIRLKDKDLENVNLAIRNVLEDLQVEKEALANVEVKGEAILSSIGEGIIATGPDRKIIVIRLIKLSF